MQDNSLEFKENKNFFLVSLVLLVVVALVIVIFFKKNQVTNLPESVIEVEVPTEELTTTVTEAKQESFLFTDLMKNKQGSYVCQVEYEQSAFIYYFADERMAIDIETPESHVRTIIDHDYTYNWDVDKKVGTKFANVGEDDLEKEANVEEVADADDNDAFNPADFKCQEWLVDEVVFSLPEDVVFQDLSQMQEQMIDVFTQ